MTLKEISKYDKNIKILIIALSTIKTILFLICALVWLIGGNILYVFMVYILINNVKIHCYSLSFCSQLYINSKF